MKAILTMIGASALVGVTQPKGADVTADLSFSDAKNCVFSSKTEATFSALLSLDHRRQQWLTRGKVTIGSLTIATRRVVTPKNDVAPGGKFYEIAAPFPVGTLWRGLRIKEIRRHQGVYPERDSFEERQLVFDEPAAKVQATMKQLGVAVPMPPKFRELDEGEEDLCGGAMSIVALKAGSYLACNWEC